MFITFSYLNKPTKAAAKNISKKNRKKLGLPFGKEKYTIPQANRHLQALSKELHEANQATGNFSIILSDPEGIIETAGTVYEFGPIDYAVESGLGASLTEVIQKDIYMDTDENMSVEESYRNDKLIEQLDKAIEDDGPSVELDAIETQPWEESNNPNVNERDLDKAIQAERSIEEEIDQIEEQEEPETAVEEELIEVYQDPEEKLEQEPKQFFDYEAYISPISDSSELFAKQDAELEELTSIQMLLADCMEEEPWLNEKIKQFLQNEYAQSDVSSLKQVFDRTRQEALSKTRALLAEQYRNIQEDKVEERAYSQLAPSMNDLEEQFSDDLQQFIGSLEEKWQSREQELQEKETQEIERISKEIQSKYSRIKTKELEEKEAQITKFTADEQKKYMAEKERLLEQEKIEIIKEHDETLTQVRIEAKKETEDHIKNVFTNAVQMIQDKNKEIIATVNDQVKLWKEEHQKELQAKELAAEKERKEAVRQQRIQLQKEKQALRKKELQLKEMELGKEPVAPVSNGSQPIVFAYPPNNDQGTTKTDQLIADLRQEVLQLKQKGSQSQEKNTDITIFKNKLNGLLISGVVLGSLLIGGLSVGLYNHFSGSDEKAEVETVASLPSTPSESNALGESSNKEIISSNKEADQNETVYPSAQVDKMEQDKIREFLFDAENKEQLESFNNAYPSTIGDLELAILNNHAENVLKAYEKLSEADRKELGPAHKIAVRAYYTANNEISKAEEVK